MARKILLADDSVTAQNMGRRILSDAGYDVTTVNNGSAALKKIAESKPDLIVLDVYMPGYGGLEVCQRLREAPETARIPVLLTVGKLEPFKAEESRRVRADGFIVKPFEASELLTALTKLEDKIVPQSQPAKPSRFAKALAGMEEIPTESEFDTSETGWKNRLAIPPPHSKHRAAAAEESPAVAKVREESGSDEQKPAEMKSGLEEAMLSSMPQDVTAEEIAAIRAAAAALTNPSDESSFKPQPVLDQGTAPTPETTATTGEQPRESGRFAGEVPVESASPQMLVSEPDASLVTSAETGNLADDEVTAALESLAPTNGHGPSAANDGEANSWEPAAGDQVPVTMAAGGEGQHSGPRWIAELVPVREDEATLILEQEMEKAYAAFAAADAARMGFAGSPAASNSYLPEVAVSQSGSTRDESFSSSAESRSEPSSAAASSTADAVSESAISHVEETAAYAAAASAGTIAAEVTMDAVATSAPSPVVESPESIGSASDPSTGPGESELAAAWANWKQIRESVVDSHVGSQIAETVVEMKESHEAQSDSQPAASSSTEDESSEISNIVDSVLADLKPKLMAEIAKKMGREKKK